MGSVKKKDVDKILKDLEFEYAYNLANRDRENKKKPYGSMHNMYNTRVSSIEKFYCNIYGLSCFDKVGQAIIRRLKKQAKESDIYKRVRKLK